jgi:Fe-Mn family superoxide dismutase
VPSLDNHEQLQQNGVPKLLSAQSFKTAYTDYQQHIVDELNASTDGTAPAIVGWAWKAGRD